MTPDEMLEQFAGRRWIEFRGDRSGRNDRFCLVWLADTVLGQYVPPTVRDTLAFLKRLDVRVIEDDSTIFDCCYDTWPSWHRLPRKPVCARADHNVAQLYAAGTIFLQSSEELRKSARDFCHGCNA
jgi:hypothetical protein